MIQARNERASRAVRSELVDVAAAQVRLEQIARAVHSYAAGIVKKRGARNIYAGVAHAVLVDVAIPRLQKSEITELVTTNSTPVRTVEGFKVMVLCVSELLGEGIKRIHNDESVSSLFNIENEKNGKTS